MKVYQRTINYTKDGEKFKLIAYGDVHCGAAACDKVAFVDMLKCHGRKINTYLIDMGDACDSIVVSDSKRFDLGCIDPDMFVDDYIDSNGKRCMKIAKNILDRQRRWYVEQHHKYVDPDKFLGIVSGNHHETIANKVGTDMTEEIARALKCENLGYTFFYRLLFKREGKGYQELVVYGHHGHGGGGRTEGTNLTKFAKNTSYYIADIMLYGHTHDKFAKRIPRIRPLGQWVHEVPVIVANTGTFLRTLGENEHSTYSERAGYPPRDLGYVIIDITTPTEDKPYFDLRGTV